MVRRVGLCQGFNTLKYRPGYPEKTLNELVDARRWVTQSADWYNNEHRYSAIRFVTPGHASVEAPVVLPAATAALHAGQDEELLRRREKLSMKLQKSAVRGDGAGRRATGCQSASCTLTPQNRPTTTANAGPDEHVIKCDN
jgi:hypothetical protein